MVDGPLVHAGLDRVSPGLRPLREGLNQKPSPSAQGPSFSELLAEAVQQVNRLQLEGEAAAASVAAGQDVDLHQVALAVQRAELALQLTVSIRNRLIEAYQEISRMQV